MRRNVYTNNIGRQGKWLQKAVATVLLVAAASIAISCFVKKDKAETSSIEPTVSETLLKVTLPEGTPEIICNYAGFTVSFNPTRHIPNYAAWELTAEEVNGSESRGKYNFAEDDNVYGCATLQDYRNSGFDRGHMAPAGDMKWSADAMRDCHYLTNIVPQDHSLNSGRWNALEQKCRTIAATGDSLIIICGPILTDRITRTIGNNVAVPERFFKVMLTPNTTPPRAIAWVMPNRRVRESLSSMAVSVDQLEEITGMDFFSTLPDSIERQVESPLRVRDWNIR